MDYEEGEVDDISDTESDVVSPSAERQIQEGASVGTPTLIKKRRDRHAQKKPRLQRAHAVSLDGLRSLSNGSLNQERPVATQCYSDEEDFQIIGRERDDVGDSFGDRTRDTGRSLLGPGAYSALNEHGDIDYRCAQTQNYNTVNYGRQSPPQLLFTPIFNPRPFAPDPYPEMAEIINPGFKSLPNQPLKPQFFPDNRFVVPSSSHFSGQQFASTRLESPLFRHMSPGQRLRPDIPLNPRPRQLGLLPARPTMFGEFPNSLGVPRFRPPHFRTPIRNPPPIHSNGFKTAYPTDEEIVRSELDKMAALLASSKPPSSSSNASIDPRTQSPEQHFNPPHIPTPNEDSSTIPPDPKATHVQRSVSVSSPEGGSSESQQLEPLNKSSAIAWRLIQLDMNVKIPYPLMQLDVENLPHRFDDPRLRGHLTAFRMQSNQAMTSLPEVTESTEEKEVKADTNVNPANISTIPNDTPLVSQTASLSSPVQRRPVKLQLNEMANTFLVSQQPMRFQSRHGDRSYLDDPRFRRRRILTSSVVGLPLASEEEDDRQPSDIPTTRSESRASLVEIQGDMQHTST